MQSIARLLIALVPLTLSACNDDHHGDYAPGPVPPQSSFGSQAMQASLQVIHASPDAPPVTVLVDGSVFAQELDYGQGSGERSVSAGPHTIEIQALTPGAPTTVIGPTTLSLDADTEYVVAAEGPVASIGAQTFSQPFAGVGPGSTQLQVLHAAPNAPSIALYVTAPGADLAASTPLGTAAFEAAIGPTQIAAGQYEIRVTASGTTTPVLFDSGTIAFAGGSNLVISALDNEGPGTAPIFLSVVDAYGNQSRLLNVATPAALRVIHDSPNAPAISVITNGNVTAPLVPSLSFEAFTPYVSLPAGNLNVEITPASNMGDALINQTVGVPAGSVQSLYVVGKLAGIQTFVTTDYDRRYATQAKLRIIQGAPSAGPVDVYLTADGTSIATSTPIDAHLDFPSDTGFVSYAAGTYELTITPAGSKTAVIGPTTVKLANDGIYTAVARDAPGGGSPPGLILLDDFANPPATGAVPP
jgi:hypothetical protein